jgi:hypothetical protein
MYAVHVYTFADELALASCHSALGHGSTYIGVRNAGEDQVASAITSLLIFGICTAESPTTSQMQGADYRH